MKKSLSIILFLSIAMLSYAQKGSVNKAKSYRTKGDLISAKAEIDVAITIEKVAKKSATWFERGQIYQAIATSKDDAVKGLDNKAIEKSVEAYKKVLSMEKEGAVNAVFSNQNIEALWGSFLNVGGEVYGAKDYPAAYLNFVDALKVKPEDSLTLLYAGVSSQQAEMYDKTAEHYYKMDDLGIASVDVYSTLIYIERAINKDDEKALAIIVKAKDSFPSESKFSQEEISVLINLDKLDEAKIKLKTEIEKDPTNVSLYLNLAIMYDNLGTASSDAGNEEEAAANYEVAKTNYKKAVELDRDNYVGNFNLGAIYVNAAKIYYDQVRDMGLNEYDKKGPALIEKADAILKEGMSYMKRATEVKPEDVDALKALQQMYIQLKMLDEAEAVMNKVDALTGEGK